MDDSSTTDSQNLEALLARIKQLEDAAATSKASIESTTSSTTPSSAIITLTPDSYITNSNHRTNSFDFELISDQVISEKWLEFNDAGFEIVDKIPHASSYLGKPSKSPAIRVEGHDLPVPLDKYFNAIKVMLFILKTETFKLVNGLHNITEMLICENQFDGVSKRIMHPEMFSLFRNNKKIMERLKKLPDNYNGKVKGNSYILTCLY